jgi:hypothetical protein
MAIDEAGHSTVSHLKLIILVRTHQQRRLENQILAVSPFIHQIANHHGVIQTLNPFTPYLGRLHLETVPL